MIYRFSTSALIVSLLFLIFPLSVLAQSTSPKKNAATKEAKKAVPEDAITFSEFPKGTSITDQYRDKGIIFGGSDPFITSDGANPTSPVLSGSPRFEGEITGKFVEPGTDEPTVVQSFTLDAGFFNADGSTRISWFGPDGEKLGQRTNSEFGIERFEIEGGNIERWRIEIIETEPAGYAIDNVSIESAGSSILFREIEGASDAWRPVPGWDHTALHYEEDKLVYESHPTYSSSEGNVTNFVTPDGEKREIEGIDGVQFEHTLPTFRNYTTEGGYTPGMGVKNFERIPIDSDLAKEMVKRIRSVEDAGFNLGPIDVLTPASQKGSNGTYTCVGLIEWAAEESGKNLGEGFVPDVLESANIDLPELEDKLPGIGLLSPQLLNWSMKTENLIEESPQLVQGIVDPVDFVVVDPLGRRLGHVDGETFREIPQAFFSGDGEYEQFVIPKPLPGPYEIKFVGTDDDVAAAVSISGTPKTTINRFLTAGESATKKMSVDPKARSRGDVDGDGDVDEDDIEELKSKITRFTDGLSNPGDLNGDGKLSDKDVSLLTDLVGAGESGNATGQVFYPIEGQGSLQAGRPLEGLKVEVRSESGDVLGTATTGEDGSYQLEVGAGGPYEVGVDRESIGNALQGGQHADVFDLVRAVQALFGFDPLVGPFHEQVADVDGTGGLQSPDLFQIIRFTSGTIGGFEAGPWAVGTEENVQVEANGAATGVDLEVAERGDVDLSGGAASKDEQSEGKALALATTRSGTASLQPGETAEIPVRLEGGASVGAYALALDVPAEKIELQGVEAPAGEPRASLEEGTLMVGWAAVEAPPLEVGDGEALAVLKVAVPEGTEGGLELEVSRAAAVGPEGAPLEGATLAVPGLEAGPERPEEFALRGSRPNPASGPARIVVDLPERAAVTVEVYNTLGQRVLEVRETMAGGRGQALQLDGSGLSSGQYFYRVRAELGEETVRETGRLTVVR